MILEGRMETYYEKIKKIITSILALCILLNSFGMVSMAEDKDIITETIMGNGTIIENGILNMNGARVDFNRQTKPDGTTIVKVTENGTTYIQEGRINYQELKNRVMKVERKGDGVGSRAVEHIANCYHRTLATNSIIVTRQQGATSAAAIAAVLAGGLTANPKVIKIVAGAVYDYFRTKPVAYQKVTEEVNEVFFSFDNVYYTHCYHDLVQCYDDYDHLVDTYTEYLQSVGG